EAAGALLCARSRRQKTALLRRDTGGIRLRFYAQLPARTAADPAADRSGRPGSVPGLSGRSGPEDDLCRRFHAAARALWAVAAGPAAGDSALLAALLRAQKAA